MKKLTLCITLCVLVSTQLSAIGYEWYGLANSSGTYTSTDLVYHNDYLYGVCEFDSDTVTIGGNILVNTGSGTKDIFVFKSDTLGNVIWVKRYGGTNDEISHNLAVDDLGNVLITGSFKGSGVFGATTLVSQGGYDVFTLRINNTGNLLWAKSFGGTADDHGEDICSDYNHDIYVVSTLKNTLTFASTTSSKTTSYMGISKYSSMGIETWYRYTTAYGAGQRNDKGKAIKYNPKDSTILAMGGANSDNLSTSNAPNNLITLGNNNNPMFIVLTTANTVLRFYDYSQSSLGNRPHDMAITDSGKILRANDIPLSLGGESGVSLGLANHLPNNLVSNLLYHKFIVDNNGNHISIKKVSEDNNFGFATLEHYLNNAPCEEYALIEHPLYSNNLIQHPSIKITSITNKNNNVYVGGDDYIGKVCFSSCPVSAPVQPLQINPFPDVTSCPNNSIQIGYPLCDYVTGGVPPYIFSWTSSGNITQPSNSQTNVSASGNIPFYLLVTDANNNVVYDTVNLSMAASSITNLTLSSTMDTICVGDTIQFSAGYSGIPSSYQWGSSFGSNFFTGFNFTDTSSIGTSGYNTNSFRSGIITFTTFDSNGCNNSVSKTIVIKPKTVNLSSTATPVFANAFTKTYSSCSGTVVTLTGTGGTAYSWSSPNLNITNGVPFTPPLGNYSSYTLTAQNIYGCTEVINANIVISVPTVFAKSTTNTSPVFLCLNDSVTLYGDHGPGSSNGLTYSWNQGILNNVPFSPTTTKIYKVTGTDADGCTATSTIQVRVYDPTINITTNPTPAKICQGSSITINNSNTNTNIFQYIKTPFYTNPVTPTSTTTYTVRSTSWNPNVPNHCKDTASITVIVDTPSFSIATSPTMPIHVCPNDTVTLSASGGQSYSWNGGINNNTSFIPSSSQTYVVSVTDSNGCVGQDSVEVLVHNSPIITATNVYNLNPLGTCQGDSILLWGNGAQSYSWTGGINDSIPFLTNLNQTYIVTGTDSNGCSNSDSINVIINNLPTVSANSSTNPLLCAGDSIFLFGSGAQSYSWSGGISDSISFLPTSQNYILTGTDSNGCTAEDSIHVIVNNLPAIVANNPLNTSPYIICPSDSALLWGSGALTYAWTGSINDSIPFVPSMNQWFTIIGTDSNGCIGIDSIELGIAAYPIDTLVSYPPQICYGAAVALGAVLNYCTPIVDSMGAGPHLERVRIKQNFNTVYENITGDGPGDHNIYLDSIKLIADSVYTLEIKRDNPSGSRIKYRGAWIDYNKDGYFDNLTERIAYSTFQNPQNVALSFQIPTSVENGYTVLRVAGSTNTPFGPCRLKKGEYEDYTIEIISGQAATPQFIWSPSSQLIDTAGSIVTSSTLFTPTTFMVHYTDTNTCVFMDSITIAPNPLPAPSLSFSGNSTLSCSNAPLTATYNWSLNGSPVGTNNSTLTINQNGQYIVEAIDSLGCSGFDTLDVINVGTRDYLSNQTIQLFPNPTSNVFTIQSDKIIKGQVEVLNLLGKRILSEPINTKQQQFELNQIAKGAYIVRITAFDKKRIIYVARLMIN